MIFKVDRTDDIKVKILNLDGKVVMELDPDSVIVWENGEADTIRTASDAGLVSYLVNKKLLKA